MKYKSKNPRTLKKVQGKFKFCPKCGHKLVLKNLDGHKRLVCQNKKCQFIFYQNSKPTASAIITKGNKVLLTKRAVEPKKGYWDAPGGFLEKDEHPEAGLKREMREELSVEIKIIRPLGIYMGEYLQEHPESTLNLYYLAKIKKGKIRPADDITEARWFSKDEIPQRLAFKNNRQAIRDWQEMKK